MRVNCGDDVITQKNIHMNLTCEVRGLCFGDTLVASMYFVWKSESKKKRSKFEKVFLVRFGLPLSEFSAL